MCLCLVDVEIYGNPRELHYATFPAIDRRVIVVPQRLTRRLIQELPLTLYYCQQVQHRCLVKHNNRLLPLQDEQPFWATHGDYLLISVPPDETCDDATSYLLGDALRQARLAVNDSPLATPMESYSPSLVPSEDIRRKFGVADAEDVTLLQNSSPAYSALDLSPHKTDSGVSDVDPLSKLAVCISADKPNHDLTTDVAVTPSPIQHSWIEEFLQAMNALQVAREMFHNFQMHKLCLLPTRPAGCKSSGQFGNSQLDLVLVLLSSLPTLRCD